MKQCSWHGCETGQKLCQTLVSRVNVNSSESEERVMGVVSCSFLLCGNDIGLALFTCSVGESW